MMLTKLLLDKEMDDAGNFWRQQEYFWSYDIAE